MHRRRSAVVKECAEDEGPQSDSPPQERHVEVVVQVRECNLVQPDSDLESSSASSLNPELSAREAVSRSSTQCESGCTQIREHSGPSATLEEERTATSESVKQDQPSSKESDHMAQKSSGEAEKASACGGDSKKGHVLKTKAKSGKQSFSAPALKSRSFEAVLNIPQPKIPIPAEEDPLSPKEEFVHSSDIFTSIHESDSSENDRKAHGNQRNRNFSKEHASSEQESLFASPLHEILHPRKSRSLNDLDANAGSIRSFWQQYFSVWNFPTPPPSLQRYKTSLRNILVRTRFLFVAHWFLTISATILQFSAMFFDQWRYFEVNREVMLISFSKGDLEKHILENPLAFSRGQGIFYECFENPSRKSQQFQRKFDFKLKIFFQ